MIDANKINRVQSKIAASLAQIEKDENIKISFGSCSYNAAYYKSGTFELREIALSEDETRSKFEVLSVVSENMKNDSWGTQEYGDYFLKKTGGGWLDTKNLNFKSMKLTWVTTISKAEARQKKSMKY